MLFADNIVLPVWSHWEVSYYEVARPMFQMGIKVVFMMYREGSCWVYPTTWNFTHSSTINVSLVENSKSQTSQKLYSVSLNNSFEKKMNKKWTNKKKNNNKTGCNLPIRHTKGAAEQNAFHRSKGHQTFGKGGLLVHPLHRPASLVTHRFDGMDGIEELIFLHRIFDVLLLKVVAW